MASVYDGPEYGVQVDDDFFYLIVTGSGYYACAARQKVDVNGSPLIVSFDPPIAPTIDAGQLYQAIKSKLPSNLLP